MVKIEHVTVEYKRLEHYASNCMLNVAIGDRVKFCRIFELCGPKSLNSEVSNSYLPEFWTELKILGQNPSI